MDELGLDQNAHLLLLLMASHRRPHLCGDSTSKADRGNADRVKEESALGPASRAYMARPSGFVLCRRLLGAVRLLLDLPSAAGLVVGLFYGVVHRQISTGSRTALLSTTTISSELTLSSAKAIFPRNHRGPIKRRSLDVVSFGDDVHSGESAIVRLLDVALVVFRLSGARGNSRCRRPTYRRRRWHGHG